MKDVLFHLPFDNTSHLKDQRRSPRIILGI